jgi:hypothetical protein
LSDLAGAARAMVEHVRVLRKIHISGESPRYGDIECLFDLADRLDHEIRLNEPALPCAMGCKRPAVERVSDRACCARCARALRALQQQVQAEAPEIARQRLDAMLHGRVAWPAAIAEAVSS